MITVTDACRPDVRRVLEVDPGVLLVGRSASPYGARALDRCVSSIYSAADWLAVREGVDVRHLLPADPRALVAHHRTAATVERVETTDGTTAVHRWSLWSPPAAPELTLLLSTGSARAVVADSLEQLVLRRVAQVVHETTPSVVYARSLSRTGRGYPGALVDVLQAIGRTRPDGPFLGDDTISWAEIDLSLKLCVSVQGLVFDADYRRLAAQPRLANGRFAGRRADAGAAGSAR